MLSFLPQPQTATRGDIADLRAEIARLTAAMAQREANRGASKA
jgi:uncharacterized small protein (DUF1192 family)